MIEADSDAPNEGAICPSFPSSSTPSATRWPTDYDQTLAALAGFGFTAVEPFQFDAFADELRRGLPAHGLSAPTAHVGLLSGDQDTIFALATELGIGTLIVPCVDQARWQTADDVAQIAIEINDAAAKAAGHGLRIGYHNHHFELESKFDGRHALEVFADHLAPEVVLEVDTYWAYAGGADVPALLERLGERVVALHIKDGDGTLDTKKQVPAGSGVIPIARHHRGRPRRPARGGVGRQ